jgi:hypothetical protein
MTNPFEALAAAEKPAWEKRKERIADKRAATFAARVKADDEAEQLTKLYNAMRRGRLAALESGPYGEGVKALRKFLRTMTLESAPDLIEVVRCAHAGWLGEADPDTRHEVLDLISRGITSLRERNGLTPYDDPMPDEPLNAFLEIREMLNGRGNGK